MTKVLDLFIYNFRTIQKKASFNCHTIRETSTSWHKFCHKTSLQNPNFRMQNVSQNSKLETRFQLLWKGDGAKISDIRVHLSFSLSQVSWSYIPNTLFLARFSFFSLSSLCIEPSSFYFLLSFFACHLTRCRLQKFSVRWQFRLLVLERKKYAKTSYGEKVQ